MKRRASPWAAGASFAVAATLVAGTLCADAGRTQARVASRTAPGPMASAEPQAAAAAADALACDSYDQPPDGVYGVLAVACDQAQLDASGADLPSHPALRWLDALTGAQLGDPGPPAVVRSEDPSRLEHLELAAATDSAPRIYLARVSHDGVFTRAAFAAIRLSAGERLVIDAPAGGPWRLLTATGAVVAQADPVQRQIPPEIAPSGPPAPLPRGLHLRRGPKASILSWRILRPARVRFHVLVAKAPRSQKVSQLAHLSVTGGTRFHVTLRNTLISGRYIRVLAVRGSRSRQSAAIRGPVQR